MGVDKTFAQRWKEFVAAKPPQIPLHLMKVLFYGGAAAFAHTQMKIMDGEGGEVEKAELLKALDQELTDFMFTLE